MGIQINGNTDNISSTDGGLTVSDLELNQTGVSTFHSHLHVADQIIHLDDANSKIRFPAADTITAETAGNERLRISSDGDVLIGKTSGNHILDINASSDEIRLSKASASDYTGIQLDRDASGTAGGYFGLAGNTNHYITGAAQHDICIRCESNLVVSTGGGTEKFRIDSSGLLGLNVTPSYSGLFGGSQKGMHIGGTTAPFLRITSSTSSQGDLILQAGNSGANALIANLGAGGDLIFYTKPSGGSSTEALRIDSSGHIGIGTDNPAASLQGNWNKILEVSAGIHTGSMIRFTESGVGGGANKGMLIGEHDNNAYLINYQNGFLQFRTNGLDRGRFDAAGRLLIGNSSVEGYGDADDLTISSSGNTGMTIRSAASGYSSIFFSDATSGTGEYDGFLQYGHSSQSLAIGAGSATKMTVYNNGNVVTRGNNTGNPIGMELKNENTAAYSHAELTLTSQNATSSKIWCDIPNARLRMQYNGGTTVGIDQSGNVQLANGSGISFSASGNFGTMNSEILDDYEEGYWTPTIGGHVSDGSSTYGNQKGSYVRIGSIVHLNWYISWTSTSASGQFRIHGMPYNSASTYGTNYNITVGSMMFDNINVPYQYGQMVPYFSHATNQLVFYGSYYTSGWNILNHDSYTQNGGSMICSITYRGA